MDKKEAEEKLATVVEELVSHAISNRQVLQDLKVILTNLGSYGEAASLRLIERKLYPIDQEQQQQLSELSQAFSLLGYDLGDGTIYQFKRVFDLYSEIGGKISLSDITTIKADANKLFYKK